MNEYNHPVSGIGPFKAYIVSVFNRAAPRTPTKVLVLGCDTPRAAILTALRDSHSDSFAVHTSHAVEFDAIADTQDGNY